MATWPVSLQSRSNQSGFSYVVGETTLRSDMDIGPAKVRRRTTRPVDTMRYSINVTQAEYQTLYDFYDITTNGGVETFDMQNPITGNSMVCRFKGPPEFTPISGTTFLARFDLEVMP